MGTHNICYYKKVDNTDCNLKPTELLDCALIGVCAVIRSNTVMIFSCFSMDSMLWLLIRSALLKRCL